MRTDQPTVESISRRGTRKDALILSYTSLFPFVITDALSSLRLYSSSTSKRASEFLYSGRTRGRGLSTASSVTSYSIRQSQQNNTSTTSDTHTHTLWQVPAAGNRRIAFTTGQGFEIQAAVGLCFCHRFLSPPTLVQEEFAAMHPEGSAETETETTSRDYLRVLFVRRPFFISRRHGAAFLRR